MWDPLYIWAHLSFSLRKTDRRGAGLLPSAPETGEATSGLLAGHLLAAVDVFGVGEVVGNLEGLHAHPLVTAAWPEMVGGGRATSVGGTRRWQQAVTVL
jgi:hypothetical protein